MVQRSPLPSWTLGLLGLGVLSTPAVAQGPFIDNTASIPSGSTFNGGHGESVKVADVDLDGDWDVVWAHGGDQGNQQNRIWINLGPAQLGTFQDQTASRFPAIADQSRDIEFVDFNGNGWMDLYVSNTAQITPQSNRWWRNTGGGFYVDETAARWVGLGAPGSSIANSQLLPSGGFIDFSCNCVFGDLNNNGVMDLVHSSYGGAFGGQVPTRLFLNDGNGFFTEFNPSGFKLAGQNIQNGNPALWCEGTQQANTTNSTGAFADIASSALKVNLGDTDGDFDLDILHGARQELPRMFQNRLEENGGVLGFRDVTGAVFPSNYSNGDGHYAQEFGDLDGDGDIDIYGLNWQAAGFGFTDITLRNNGNGVFTTIYQLPNSSQDHNDVRFIDYDNDGEMDIFIANFSGKDKLYRNNGGVTNNFTDVSNLLPNNIGRGLDAAVVDANGNGVYDVFVSMDAGVRNRLFTNTGGVQDTHAPYIPNTEQAPNRVAGPTPTVIRAHVYDNTSHYITAMNPTVVEYTVDGGVPQTVTAMNSGHQVFRAELPGNLVGTIQYRWISQDEYGNTGQSAFRSYTATGAGTTGTAFCFGDGSGTACPCGNAGAAGHGCANGSFGTGSQLSGSGNPSVGSDTVVLQATSAPANLTGLFFQGDVQTNGGMGAVFGDGLRCAGQGVIRLQVKPSDGAGQTLSSVSISAAGSVSAGDTKTYQYWYRDPNGSPCGTFFNLSNGLQITWTP
jgi:hypothetical protein